MCFHLFTLYLQKLLSQSKHQKSINMTATETLEAFPALKPAIITKVNVDVAKGIHPFGQSFPRIST